MQKSKKVRMPAGIRNKLMAAVAMLLVSSIMMVSSTYAWFTLSTAPEVTGITTSVGANGNLEMALLNGETYADTSKIASAVGNSSAVTGDVTQSNITWGNLVDLSHASYGLNLIALNPAAPNHPTVEGGTDLDKTMIGTTSLLQTAEYGADGRVTKLDANTVSGVYDSTNGKWVIKETLTNATTATQTRGVRAIGVDSNMTTAQIVMASAQAAVASGKTGAANGVSAAVNDNKDTFVGLLNKKDGEAYTEAELAALKAVAEGVQTSLNSIVKTYSNAVLAALAADSTVTEDVLVKMRTELSNNTDADYVATVLSEANITNTTYSARLTTLGTAQDQVAVILGYFDGENGDDYTTATDAATIKTNVLVPLIGNSDTVYAVTADGVSVALDTSNLGSIEAIYVAGGLLKTVAEDAGIYRLTTYLGYPVYSAVVTAKTTTTGSGDDEKTTITVTITTTGNLADVASAVAGLTAANASNAEQTIADFYGYIIDFAFRTNAAGSYLQLQTEAANRVYSDGGTATMGAGSTVTFNYTAANGTDAALTTEQAEALLSAVKMIFLNPETGKVFATAKLSNIQIAESGNTATAEVVLEKTYVVAASEDDDVSTAIVALDQNIATRVSVMVYLDGTAVDNSDVANSTSSGILNLNLQFSSSAELVPMENSALKNLTAYTISFNANGGSGTMADVKGSGTYALPTTTTFTKEGYTFKGWSETADGAQITTVSKETTVYAIWEANTTSGDDTNTNTSTTYSVTLPDAGVTGATSATANTDYTFTAASGYALSNVSATVGGTAVEVTEANGTYTIAGASVTGAIVISADATRTINVTYSAGVNGANEETTKTVTWGENYTFTINEGYTLTSVTMGGTAFTDLTPTDDGTYTIAGADKDLVITAIKN